MHNSNQWLMRWALLLQSFNLNVKHVRGKDNVLAATLSRSLSIAESRSCIPVIQQFRDGGVTNVF